MGVGLAGVAMLMTFQPVYSVVLPIGLVGAGIGMSWALVAQRTMSGARPGDETVAAYSVDETWHKVAVFEEALAANA